jgi:hypothetical protein
MFTIVMLLLNCLTLVALVNLVLDPSHRLDIHIPADKHLAFFVCAGAVALVLGALTANSWAPGGDTSRLEKEFGTVNASLTRRQLVVLSLYIVVTVFSPEAVGILSRHMAAVAR